MWGIGNEHGQSVFVAVGNTAAPGPAMGPAPIVDLVAANHNLFDQGVVDGFGHVSVRHDKRPDRFLLARNMAPGHVAAADILEFTLDRDAVDARGRRVYLERLIHGEIYRKRPDVAAVMHSHTHSIVSLSIVKGVGLRAVFDMACFIGPSMPNFEISEHGGNGTDLLISSPALGRALADCFERSEIASMRGHDSTAVGNSIPHAVYRAVYAELNARYQIEAMKLGEITFLTEEEGLACVQNVEAQSQRSWDFWKAQAAAKRR